MWRSGTSPARQLVNIGNSIKPSKTVSISYNMFLEASCERCIQHSSFSQSACSLFIYCDMAVVFWLQSYSQTFWSKTEWLIFISTNYTASWFFVTRILNTVHLREWISSPIWIGPRKNAFSFVSNCRDVNFLWINTFQRDNTIFYYATHMYKNDPA